MRRQTRQELTDEITALEQIIEENQEDLRRRKIELGVIDLIRQMELEDEERKHACEKCNGADDADRYLMDLRAKNIREMFLQKLRIIAGQAQPPKSTEIVRGNGNFAISRYGEVSRKR